MLRLRPLPDRGFLVLGLVSFGWACKSESSAPRQVAAVQVSPATSTLQVGGQQQFTAVSLDSEGSVMSGRTVTWSSSNISIASVDEGGLAQALGEGSASVSATSANGVFGSAALTVNPLPPVGPFGPGPNAPSWAGKTVYNQELFDVPIPVTFASANSAGFQGLQGFPGAFGGNVYDPVVIRYPVVSTPLGTKPVLEMTFSGSTTTIDAAGEQTPTFPTNQNWGIRITGAWVGTLVFERSADGGTIWTPFSMAGRDEGAVTGSSTSGNGNWTSNTPDNNSTGLYGGLFRVRASSWTSGSATVVLGIPGGAAPAKLTAGTFDGLPSRFYTRFLLWISPNWSDGGNAGTKLFFFSQTQGNNHYVNMTQPNTLGFMQVSVHMQGGATQVLTGSPQAGPAHGTWMDIELIIEGGTAGSSNGVVRMWINGVQHINATNASIFGPGTTPGFVRLFVDPTYGGGFRPPPADQAFRIGAWYRESAP